MKVGNLNNSKLQNITLTRSAGQPTIAPVVLARMGAMDLVALCLNSSMEATVR